MLHEVFWLALAWYSVLLMPILWISRYCIFNILFLFYFVSILLYWFSNIIINKFVLISVAVIFISILSSVSGCIFIILLHIRVTWILANSSLWLAFTSYLFLGSSNPISSLILLKQFQYEHIFIQTLIIVSSYAFCTTWMYHFLSMYFCKTGLEGGSNCHFLRFSNQRIFNALLLMVIVIE